LRDASDRVSSKDAFSPF